MPRASGRFRALQLCAECDAVSGEFPPPPLATVRNVALDRTSVVGAAASADTRAAGVIGLTGGWPVPVGPDGFVARGDIRRVMVQSLRLQIQIRTGDVPDDGFLNAEFDKCWLGSLAGRDGVTEIGMTADAVRALVPDYLCDRRQAAAAVKNSISRGKPFRKVSSPIKDAAAAMEVPDFAHWADKGDIDWTL